MISNLLKLHLVFWMLNPLWAIGEDIKPITVFDQRVLEDDVRGVDFGFSVERGTVWLKIKLEDSFDNEDPSYEIEVPFAGLNLDRETNEIQYQVGEKTFVCGQIARRGWPIRYWEVRKTGICQFRTEYYEKVTQRPWETIRMRFARIFLEFQA